MRLRRIQVKMSQPALGKAPGITCKRIQKTETGVNRLGSGPLLGIAEVIDCDGTGLIDGVSDVQTMTGTPLSTLMAAKDGAAAIEALSKIKTSALRRAAVELAEARQSAVHARELR